MNEEKKKKNSGNQVLLIKQKNIDAYSNYYQKVAALARIIKSYSSWLFYLSLCDVSGRIYRDMNGAIRAIQSILQRVFHVCIMPLENLAIQLQHLFIQHIYLALLLAQIVFQLTLRGL